MKLIEIENLEFNYEKNPILKGITTDIHQGDMVALVGANGSGKSTLMKCINKIFSPNKGKIKVEGQNIAEISYTEMAKKIAYVPQYETKVSGVKVFDMVLSGRMPYMAWKPSDKDYQRVSDVMEILGISHLSMRDFNELSGGQQQMVYVARAIVQETPIILLDEPTNNLDVKYQIEIMELLKSLSNQGKTIMITLHDINLALQYCNQFLLLKSGKVFAQGKKDVISVENLENLYGVKMKMIRDGEDFFVIPYQSKS
ncbi:MAG: ABC transporter ATP-binding protein [Flavobacteriaceae bacterium]|nr:ABC transporter ATP-binding protein [Flavobacteriaceae bacterium]